MDKKKLLSLAVGLGALVVGINYTQVANDVLHLSPVLKDYVLGVELFLLTVAVPSLWPDAPKLPPDAEAPLPPRG